MSDTDSLIEMLKSQAKKHAERAVDIDRVRKLDRQMTGDIDSLLKTEAERELKKADATERLRQLAENGK